MSTPLSPELRTRLDAHLDAVEAALHPTAHTREQRRSIVDDLEAQVLEMLAARSPTPTLADLEAVLQELDPPAAYGSATAAAGSTVPPPIPARTAPVAAASGPTTPRYSRVAIWGLVCLLVSLLPIVVLVPLQYYFVRSSRSYSSSYPLEPASPMITLTPTSDPSSQPAPSTQPEVTHRGNTGDEVYVSPSGVRITSGKDSVVVSPGGVRIRSGDDTVSVTPGIATGEIPNTDNEAIPGRIKALMGMMPCLACMIGPLGLLGTVLGWVAFGQIRASQGMLRGKGLALFDGLFYPVLVVLALLGALLAIA